MPIDWELPGLSDLRPHLAREHTLKVFFQGAGAPDQKSAVLIKSYIRLVDKAVREYHSATEALPGATAHGLLVVAGHLENCVLTMRRALRFAEALRRRAAAPTPAKVAAIFRPGAQGGLADLRDAIEHLDDRLLSDSVPDGAPVALYLEDGLLLIESQSLSVEDLASWLRAMYTFAQEVTGYGAPAT